MENNGHTFKPGDVLAPKDWSRGNVVIVVVEASRWTNDIPLYKILINRNTYNVDFELTDRSEEWLSKHSFREGHINIANYNWDDLKDILEGILKRFPRMEYKPDAILRTFMDHELAKYSKLKGEETMNEGIYKVGDILEFTEVVPRQFGLWAGPVRGLVVKISDPGYEYISYRLLLSGTAGTTASLMGANIKNMTLCSAFEKSIVPAAKRIGHIDISALMFMKNDKPDYEKMMAAYAFVEAANLRKLLAEETLKRERAEAELKEQTERNKKLEAENARYLQSMTCAEKQADEAAKRIYEAREHLSHVLYCKSN